MIKNLLLLFVSTAITLIVALGGVRIFAPELLGINKDLQLVKVDTKVPPFYRNILRAEDYQNDSMVLHDPITKIRHRPRQPDINYYGPHDILGFRNHSVPNFADIVFIGDSQTYGENVAIDLSFPARVKAGFGSELNEIYNISVGGWGPIQYLEMMSLAMTFGPKLVVLAFYTGNDPLDTLYLAYGSPEWEHFAIDKNVNLKDLPPGEFPPEEDSWWSVSFSDGVDTIFTPEIRLKSNAEHPTVDVAWKVMISVVDKTIDTLKMAGIPVVMTVIPTKELVYARKVEMENHQPPQEYIDLVGAESKRIANFVSATTRHQNVEFVDVVEPLQLAALQSEPLYPKSINGHPLAAGYQIIAEVISAASKKYIPVAPNGLNVVSYLNGIQKLVLIRDENFWIFQNKSIATGNGWPAPETLPSQDPSILSNFQFVSVIDEVNPELFGPEN